MLGRFAKWNLCCTYFIVAVNSCGFFCFLSWISCLSCLKNKIKRVTRSTKSHPLGGIAKRWFRERRRNLNHLYMCRNFKPDLTPGFNVCLSTVRSNPDPGYLALLIFDLTESKCGLKLRLTVWYHNFSGISQSSDKFTISSNLEAPCDFR